MRAPVTSKLAPRTTVYRDLAEMKYKFVNYEMRLGYRWVFSKWLSSMFEQANIDELISWSRIAPESR